MTELTLEQEIEKVLTSAGYTQKEARVYRVLLENGEMTGGALITKAGLKRGITYAVLHLLQKEGLVLEIDQGKKTFFRPETPQKIFEIIQNRRVQAEHLEKSLENIMPKLVSRYKITVGKPVVQYFEGKEGLKKVFTDILESGVEVTYGAADLEKIESFTSNFSEGEIIPSRIKSKLSVKAILSDDELSRRLHGKDKAEMRESILIDKNKYPLPADIESYGDKVALMSFRPNSFMGLIVQNEDFAETLRSIFRFIFDQQQKGPVRKSG